MADGHPLVMRVAQTVCRERGAMTMVEGEPSLNELVAEPIVRMMMASDGVDLAAFKRLLEDVRLRWNRDGALCWIH